MKIGIVGCGLMGGSIAIVTVRSGYDTIIYDRKSIADKLLKINRVANNGIVTPRLSAIGTNDLNDLKVCDLIIEAVSENIELKKSIFRLLDSMCPPSTILATNTSCIPIKEMASSTIRGDRCVGLHFSNPAHVMELCELVKSDFTSDKTIRIVHEFAESLEKTVVVVKDYPGFITNRLIMPMIVEAIKIIESVQATKEDVDKVSKCGFKHPLGTIALADFIGLDTVYYICDILYKLTKEDKFAPPKLLKDMVDAGQYGKKTGRGFYEYPIH